MTSFTPPPRRLERSTTDRVLFGVCGGIARYTNLDPTLVRLVTVVLTVFTGGTPVLLYVVAWLLMPEANHVSPAAGPHPRFPPAPPRPEPGPSPRPPAGSDPIWGSEGAPWEQPSAAQPFRPTPPAPPAPPAPTEPEAPVASAEPTDPIDPVDPADPADPADRPSAS